MTITVKANDDTVVSNGAEPTLDASENQDVSRFRRILPQILACMALYLLEFGNGLSGGMATIVIPVLTGQLADKYPDETIHFSAEQASWYGSLVFLTEPLGSICSGWINEQIGRKRSILLGCVPMACAWVLMYTAQTREQVFAAGILMGLGGGLLVPMVTFVAEISEPSIRGILLIFKTMSMMLGIFSTFSLSNWLAWRDVALIGFAMPLLAATAILFIPETPHWLISRDRVEDARRSLVWLRGWKPSKAVDKELAEIVGYIELANACDACQAATTTEKCTHKSSYAEKVHDLLRMKTLRPFALLLFCFVVIHSSGNMAIRPFLVQLFKTFGIPLDANVGLVVFGLIDILSNICCVFAIPTFGKRPVFLIGLTMVAISCFVVGTNAFYTLPFETTSFDTSHAIGVGDNYVAMIFLMTCAIGASISGCVPWMMNSEIYPFRVRGTASGITSAFSFIGIFIATKTYLNIELGLSIGGGFILYGSITTIGLIVLYQVLPETEGRTLEEIEYFFSDKTRKLTDRHIRRITSRELPVESETVARTPDASKLKGAVGSLDNPGFVENV